MANKRQRLARKWFSKSTDAASDPSHDSAKLEKKALTNTGKRKRVQYGDSSIVGDPAEYRVTKKPKQELGFVEEKKKKKEGQRNTAHVAKLKKLNKHPLRVTGKKPGDGCFICKANDHVAKWCPRKEEKDRKKVCLFCRQVGHTLHKCPTKQDGEEMKICYNCGVIGHRLADCTDTIRDGGTRFAKCFVCKQEGHLSKHCPSNTHGIYPKGGSCKVCGSISHLAKDCPAKGTGKPSANGVGPVKLHISKEVANASPQGGSKRIVFGSGDDLEDDFYDAKDGANAAPQGEISKENMFGSGDDLEDDVYDAGIDQGTGLGNQIYEESSYGSRENSKQKGSKKMNGLTLKPVVKNAAKLTPKVVNFMG